MSVLSLTLRLPDWVDEFLATSSETYPTLQDRMLLAIELARLNCRHKTGGPFGAAIIEQRSGKVVAVGVNIVVPSRCSMAHAEMMAIALAQHKLEYHELGGPSMPSHELVTSVEPCAMCFGAIMWSGVRRVVCGARSTDASAIGFDEGPKPPAWVSALEARNISVVQDICGEEARNVLHNYALNGGEIYNARQNVSQG
jgi:tRNA(Arg) A34 adenosine deaminase TadA